MASYGNSEFFQVLRLAAEGECSMRHRMMLEYSALVARGPGRMKGRAERGQAGLLLRG